MNDVQRGVLILLKSAMTGQSMELPEGFSMEEAFPLIKAHQLIPIAFEGAVLCGVSRKLPIMRQMLQGYLHCTLISEGQMEALGQIFSAFERNGIDYMPVKGCNMKPLFPKPEMRQMGDADILIRVEQYEKIKPLLAELGFAEQGESDHELVWGSDRLHLELHKRLIPSRHTDFCAYFGDGWALARKTEGSRYEMSREDEFLYLFTHYAKHYRAGGIGCRHILDLWVYRRAYPDLDEAQIRKAMEKIQLLEFYENTCAMIRYWFEDQDGDERAEFMSDFIFSSGSWGALESRALGKYAREARLSGSAEDGRRKVILQTVFPPVDRMQFAFPFLKKAPWLTPVFWPVRWVRVLLFHRDKLHSRGAELKNVTADRVELYHQSLRYVGLDYHFDEE